MLKKIKMSQATGIVSIKLPLAPYKLYHTIKIYDRFGHRLVLSAPILIELIFAVYKIAPTRHMNTSFLRRHSKGMNKLLSIFILLGVAALASASNNIQEDANLDVVSS